MRGWPGQLIGGLWLFWAVYWLIAAFRTKPTRRRESNWLRPVILGIVLLAVVLRGTRRAHGWLTTAVIPGAWVRYWAGVALVVAGLGFASWARVVLGGNWSSWVVVKEGHELIEQGPYRHIRHPIYSGLLLAFLGSVLAMGRVRGLLALVLILPVVWLKLRAEERVMQREFGDRYIDYRASTWALIPFLL
jgi:protein-S-isoprenylcysteine O-methyltransferase Ste14